MNKVGIIGKGWVGGAMKELFPDAIVYNREEKNRFEINQCGAVFICVPTPLTNNARLDVSIVEECISWLDVPLIIIRSTVNPGDCDRWTKQFKKEIVFQPEYLGETPNHPLLDETVSQFLIIGGTPQNRRKLIELYITVYNANTKIREVTNLEAEVIKLSENRAIAFKVMQCQELYDVCEAAGLDYYTIRDAVYGDDPRFNLWFTFIYPERRGFNSSKCLKKDVPAWCGWAQSVGIDPMVTIPLVLQSNSYEEEDKKITSIKTESN